MPMGWDTTEPKDLIVATDGSYSGLDITIG
jgi:hypothetical protein